MSPKPPDLPKEEKVSRHETKNVLSNEKEQKSPITPQFNKKLVSEAKKLSDSVLKLSKKVDGDPPVKPIEPKLK